MKEVNESAQKIRDQVFHTFPFGTFRPNFKGPHADDCPGCIIEAELDKLVEKLNELAPVEKIIAELDDEKAKVESYKEDRSKAFIIGGLREEGSVASLVAIFVSEKDRLTHLLGVVKNDLTETVRKLNENENHT